MGRPIMIILSIVFGMALLSIVYVAFAQPIKNMGSTIMAKSGDILNNPKINGNGGNGGQGISPHHPNNVYMNVTYIDENNAKNPYTKHIDLGQGTKLNTGQVGTLCDLNSTISNRNYQPAGTTIDSINGMSPNSITGHKFISNNDSYTVRYYNNVEPITFNYTVNGHTEYSQTCKYPGKSQYHNNSVGHPSINLYGWFYNTDENSPIHNYRITDHDIQQGVDSLSSQLKDKYLDIEEDINIEATQPDIRVMSLPKHPMTVNIPVESN